MKAYLLLNEIKSSLILSIILSAIIYALLFYGILIFPYEMNIGNDTLKSILFIPANPYLSRDHYAFIMEYIIMASAIMATVLSTKTLVHDKVSGYDEYLFSLPTTRGVIFYNKLLAILIELIIFNIGFYVLSIVFNYILDLNLPIKYILKMNSALTLSQLTFASIGVLAGSFIKPKNIYLKNILFIIALVLIAIPERLYNITLLRYINPFSYFKLNEIISSGYKMSFLIASGCIIIFSISISKTSYDEYDVLKRG